MDKLDNLLYSVEDFLLDKGDYFSIIPNVDDIVYPKNEFGLLKPYIARARTLLVSEILDLEKPFSEFNNLVGLKYDLFLFKAYVEDLDIQKDLDNWRDRFFLLLKKLIFCVEYVPRFIFDSTTKLLDNCKVEMNLDIITEYVENIFEYTSYLDLEMDTNNVFNYILDVGINVAKDVGCPENLYICGKDSVLNFIIGEDLNKEI